MHHPYADNSEEIIAHMSPAEIKELAQMQGGMEFDPHTRLPSFKRLMELFNHPQVKSKLIEWEGNNFAGGGEVEGINNFLRSSGRFGDTQAVKLPTVIANLFDRALNNGHPSINPHTGKREYFLGGVLGGIGNILKPITSGISSVFNAGQKAFSPVFNTLKNIAQPITNALSPIAGGALRELAPSIGDVAGTALGGLGAAAGLGPAGLILGNMAGRTIGNLGSQIGSDMETRNSQPVSHYARQGASQFGQGAAPVVGQSIANAGQNYAAQMNNPYARQFANHAANLGGQMATNMGHAGATAIGQNTPANLGATALGTASNYVGQMDHPMAKYGAQALDPATHGLQTPNLVSSFGG